MKTQLSQAEKRVLKLESSCLTIKYQCFKAYVLMAVTRKRLKNRRADLQSLFKVLRSAAYIFHTNRRIKRIYS